MEQYISSCLLARMFNKNSYTQITDYSAERSFSVINRYPKPTTDFDRFCLKSTDDTLLFSTKFIVVANVVVVVVTAAANFASSLYSSSNM